MLWSILLARQPSPHTSFCLRYAEMDKDIKNTISHRYRALEKLKAYLASQQE